MNSPQYITAIPWNNSQIKHTNDTQLTHSGDIGAEKASNKIENREDDDKVLEALERFYNHQPAGVPVMELHRRVCRNQSDQECDCDCDCILSFKHSVEDIKQT